MAHSHPVRALILDYGNVLTRDQREDWLEAMAALAHAPRDQFIGAYWAHRHAYDSGLSAGDYWYRVAHAVGHVLDDPTIDRLVELDVRSWMDYREEVWDLARAFRAAGGRTAFLSNGVPEIMARIRADRALEQWFDTVVVSYEVGLAKPDPRIFELCLARLGAETRETLFVDDRADNVEAAARLGIRTVHFTGDDAFARLAGAVRSGTSRD